MNDQPGHPAQSVDWKTVFAGVALSWSILIGGGTLFRAHLLATVDERIAQHSEAAAAKRADFLRELESRADGALGRINQLEQHCASIRDWRSRVDTDLAGLHGWRERCAQRQERCQAWMESDGRRMDALEGQLEKLKERIRTP